MSYFAGGGLQARAGNDSWDPATGVGATATMVAAARAVAAKADNALIDDPLAEPLVRAVGIDFFARWVNGEIHDLMSARTRYFDAFFRDATATGIRQSVIPASGLDARAYRMSWPDGTTVFEIDQPQVIEFKSATLEGLGARPAADLRVVPIDLRQDWPTALRAKGFDAGRPGVRLAADHQRAVAGARVRHRAFRPALRRRAQ